MAGGLTQVGPGRLQVREGGGCMALFGLPFFLCGIGVMLAVVGGVPVQDAETAGWYARPLIFFMGVVFAFVGAALVFGRSWTTFDANTRTVGTQMGLLVPMTGKTHRFDDYSSVLIHFERGDSDTADQFPVSLRARTGTNLRLFSSTDYAEARQRASAIAGLLHFDIEDASTDHPLKLSPAQADLSFQQRQRLAHQREESVARPVAMRSEIAAADGKVVVVIPAQRRHPALFLFFLIPAAVPVLFVAPFFRFFEQSHTPDVVSWIFLGFLTVAFGVLPVLSGVSAFLKSRLGRTIVTVSTTGIRIEERRVWKTRPVASFDAADVLDIDFSTSASLLESARQQAARSFDGQTTINPVVEGTLVAVSRLVDRNAITVKTRKGLTTFGEGLAENEIRYLHSVVRRALVHGGMP